MHFVWKIIFIALVIRLLFIIGMPLEETSAPRTLSAFNDEKAHYKYVIKMERGENRPKQKQYQPEDFHLGEFEYYQSPLWYRIAGAYLSFLPEAWRGVRAVRLLNALTGMLTILTIGRIMLFFSPQFGLSSMICISLLGGIVYYDSAVTNDILLWLLCALTVYFGISALKSGDRGSRWGMILSFSAGVWTKQSALLLLPGIFYAVFQGYVGQPSWKRIILALVYIAIGLLFCVPLFWENYIYYGQFIPLSIGSGEPYNLGAGLNPQFLARAVAYAGRSFYFPFTNFWGGAPSIIIFIILGSLSLILIYHGIKHSINILKSSLLWYRRSIVFLGLILAFALGGYSLMIFRYHQTEARHTFIALPAIIYLLISGGYTFLGKRSYRLAQLVAGITALPYLLFLI
jgi:4-amino-4-deoxy-L-arabinose transferase-like glycosyltransferase